MKLLLAMNLPYVPALGGANKSNRLLLEALAAKGHSTLAVVPALGMPSSLTFGEWIQRLRDRDVDVECDSDAGMFRLRGVDVCAAREDARLQAVLAAQVEAFDPDWLLVSSEDPSQRLLQTALRLRPSRVVYLARTTSFLPFGPQAFFAGPKRARLLEQTAAIVAVSEFLAAYIRRWSGLSARILPLSLFGAPPFPALGRFEHGFVTMLNPCASKGIAIFLALAARLPDTMFAAVPTWGTTEADRLALAALPNVRVLMPSEDIDEILAQTQVLLVPSLWPEARSRAVVEAMLRGVPVLASDVGGNRETLLDPGSLVPVRPIERFDDTLDGNLLPAGVVPEQDIEPWVERLTTLLHDGDAYARAAQRAREAGHAFAASCTTDPLEDLFAELEAARAVRTPARPVSACSILEGAERHRVLIEWNRTRVDYGAASGLHGLVEAQAARTPAATAVVFEGRESSYAELDRRAGQLARYLRARGVRPEGLVGVCVERSTELVIALLGVLKAGAAYVPLDPGYPQERLEFMLRDSGATLLLTQAALANRFAGTQAAPVCLDRDWPAIEHERDPIDTAAVEPDSLAYVIYTSGSTGRPKGAMNTHRGIVNRLQWMQQAYRLQPGESVVQKTPFSFDVSVWELFWTLMAGGRLVMARPGGHQDPAYLRDLIVREQVTTAHFVPSMLQLFLEEPGLEACRSLRRVICSGEALPFSCQTRFFARLGWAELFNLYGPTEAAVDVTHWTCRRDGMGEVVPIGTPIANTRTYILDPRMEPVPIGAAGELHLGGVGLGRGYWRRPALTAERFIPDPFDDAGGRLYKTSDLARFLPDGSIEFLGRLDHQVKIRGFRIELGEIERVLTSHPGIREAVVVARDQPGGLELVGYWAGAADALDDAALRSFLRGTLPDYMVPSHLVRLDALPLSPNGKLDRAALPPPSRPEPASAPDESPRTPLECTLAEIWCGVLDTDRVGLHDDFFERGGHSLLAARLIRRVREACGVDVPLRVLFDAPTIAGLAEVVEERLRCGPASARGGQGIARRPQSGPAPLSFAQRRLWFLEQLDPGNSAYNMPNVSRLAPGTRLSTLRAACRAVVERHEILRTVFALQDDEPVQIALPAVSVDVPSIDLTSLPAPMQARARRRLIREEASRPFDLTRGPLLRVSVLRTSGEDIALLTSHHIVCDAWSCQILAEEIAALYDAIAESRPAPLPPLPIQYADFAWAQQTSLGGDGLTRELAYWQSRLAGAPPLLTLPLDRPRPAVQTYRGGTHAIHLSRQLTQALRALSRREGTTLFMTLLAAFQVLLARYAGQSDVSVGIPMAGRTHLDVERLLGCFVNMAVLRSRIAEQTSFLDHLRRVREDVLEADAHQGLPFEKLVEALQPERSLSHTPLVQVMFALQDTRPPRRLFDHIASAAAGPAQHTARFDLTLALTHRDDRLSGAIDYRRDLFDRTTIARMGRHLETLLSAVVHAPAAPLHTIPLADAAERHQILVEWNATAAAWAAEPGTVHGLVEAQVARTPAAPAVVAGATILSYAELNARAEAVAAHLRARGVGPEQRVGLCVERSPAAIVGVLGILKAGGVYVPIEPSYPAPRRALIARDAGLTLVIGDAGGEGQPCGPGVAVLRVETASGVVAEAAPPPLGARRGTAAVTGQHLAYVLYTSGSTGQPKGVMVDHAALVNTILWRRATFGLSAATRVLHNIPSSFDPSLWQIFGALSAGAALVLVAPQRHHDLPHVVEVIQRSGATTADFPPTLLQELVAQEALGACETLRHVFVGGEPLSRALWEAFERQVPQARLHQVYGPTEAAIDTTCWSSQALAAGRRVPIGRPIANKTVYLLDAARQPVPRGAVGELYIGGAGVARGYLGAPGLTAARFVPDPFAREAGARLYATGDLARAAADGTLEFVGRRDRQVKVRGVRIELGEIESVLRRHRAIRDAHVMTRDDAAGEPRLVAYVVSDGSCDEARLRDALRAQLPAVMVPSALVMLAALPHGTSGKIDAAALPQPDWGMLAEPQAYAAPRTPMEELIAAAWSDVLALERVGAHDDFFALGGHSILAARVAVRLQQRLGIEIPVRALFAHPTVAALADHLSEIRTRKDAGLRAALPQIVRRANPGQEAPLSFAQERLWFIDQLDPASGAAYKIHALLRLEGALDVAALRGSVQEIVRRHEVLRTTFRSVDGEPRQVVDPAGARLLPLVDVTALPEPQRAAEARRLVRAQLRQPVDLAVGPAFQVSVSRLDDRTHLLLLVLHHVIADGWSMGVLFAELTAIYNGFRTGASARLPDPPVQYADFAVWQRTWLQGPALERQEAYWRAQLTGVPALELPADRPRPARVSLRGAGHRLEVPPPLARALDDLGRREGATLFMTLSAAFALLLHRYTGQQDVAIGTPVADRRRAELEPLIGLFLNTLVLRVDLRSDPRFDELLRRVREVCLDAYAHQDLPFERIVQMLQVERSLSRAPLCQVMVILNSLPADPPQLDGLQVSADALAGDAVIFDLVLTLTGDRRGLAGSLKYSTDLFDRTTAARMARDFEALLEEIVRRRQARVSELGQLSAAERHQILVEWNATAAAWAAEPGTAHGLVEAQVARTPAAPAVVAGATILSYAELNARAEAVAAHLRARGVGPEQRVGLCVERSPAAIVGVLGILKAGGVYVPIEPSYPAPRRALIARDAGLALVIGDAGGACQPCGPGVAVLRVETASGVVAEAAPPPLGARRGTAAVTGQHLAYVLYTSGSTGQPKGVMVDHAALVNTILWRRATFGLSAATRVLHNIPSSFDPSLWQIFGALSAGAALVLVAPQRHHDLPHVVEVIQRSGATTADFPPTLLQELVAQEALGACETLRHVFVGGEPLSRALWEAFERQVPQARLHQVYGPTEAAIDTTCWSSQALAAGRRVPIGRPIANKTVYLLDAARQPVPRGAVGELYIGGAGVARGYLGAPGLTAARFVPDPFAREAGARLYATGDLARAAADGTLEFVGRRDRQVKVRGVRIELGEIEHAFQDCSELAESAIVPRPAADEGVRLVAYVVFRSSSGDRALAIRRLRETLGHRLPAPMVPDTYIALDRLPRTESGKLDLQALPPVASHSEPPADPIAPRTELEELIAAVWEEILGRPHIGVDTNFFDAGGHSLLLVRVHRRLQDALDRRLSLVTLFEHPTVASLARFLTGDERGSGGHARNRVRGRALRQIALMQRVRRTDPNLRQGERA